jgi:hypothetical protein|tara:strand:+ start:360 stop:476 length:117 start_codon:yes stop_codon:yes gene_type:complete
MQLEEQEHLDHQIKLERLMKEMVVMQHLEQEEMRVVPE